MTHITRESDLASPSKSGGLLAWLRSKLRLDNQNSTLRDTLIDVLDEHDEEAEAASSILNSNPSAA